MSTVDASGAIHGSDGRFTGHVAGETDASLGDQTGASGNYGPLDRDARLQAMQADLADAVQNLVTSGRLTAYLDAVRANGMNRWSVNNQLLAALQIARREGLTDSPEEFFTRMSTIDARGAKQWNAVGRKITSGKGSALYIQAPLKRWISVEDPDRPGETKRKQVMVGVTPVAVFDVTQTDGDPLPEPLHKPAVGGTQEMLDDLQGWVTSQGYIYQEKPIPGCDPVKLSGTMASVEPATKSVVVDSRLTTAQKVQAVSHEIGHIACGHTDSDSLSEYRQHRGRMESEAEAFGYLLRRDAGLNAEDCEAFSPGYIAGWSGGDTTTVTAALDKACKAYQQYAQDIENTKEQVPA